jgi:hypothetical protein
VATDCRTYVAYFGVAAQSHASKAAGPLQKHVADFNVASASTKRRRQIGENDFMVHARRPAPRE